MTDWRDHPVLVYGPRKAGTTLLQSLLDGGPYIMTPGELKLKSLTDFEGREAGERGQRYVSRGRSVLRKNGVRWITICGMKRLEYNEPFVLGSIDESKLEGRFDAETYIRALERSFLTPPSSLRDAIVADVSGFVEAIETDGAPRGWAAKEVGGHPEAFIPEFRRMFPDAKFVFIARDPRFIVRSIILDRRRKGIELGPREIVWQWRSAIRVLRYLEIAGEADDSILIRYESLVHATRDVMGRVTSFLGVPFNESYTVPTTFGAPSQVTTSSKNTRQVFKTSTVDWTSGLRGTERAFVQTCSVVTNLWEKMAGKEPRVQEVFCEEST